MPILCLAGVLIHVVLNWTVRVTSLPLFLDTVCTVSVTLLGGLFWGSLCGALTNLAANTIWFAGGEGYIFAFCNIVTACITSLFVRFFPRELSLAPREDGAILRTRSQNLRMTMDRMIVLILLAFALCMVMSVMGGSITAAIQYIKYNSVEKGVYNHAAARPLILTMFGKKLPVLLVEILSRIPVNIIDRLITAFGGYAIALVVRTKLFRNHDFGGRNT